MRTRRPSFTLVELLVVIFLITILATISVVYVVPAFSDNKNVLRGMERTVTTLMIARMRALRDQAPRGVRFEYDATTGYARNLRYVEQPDPYRTGTVAINGTTATFTGGNLFGSARPPQPGLPDDTENYAVQPGDWIQLTGPYNFEIAAVTGPNTATLNRAPPTPLPNQSFKIIRQTRPIAGEESVLLPQNVAVNIGLMNGVGLSGFQVPVRGNTGALIYEIVFDPSGGVINRPEGAAIVLWINDETASDPAEANTTKLISIHPRTGLMATHPRGPAGDPLSYIKDGRSSGE